MPWSPLEWHFKFWTFGLGMLSWWSLCKYFKIWKTQKNGSLLVPGISGKGYSAYSVYSEAVTDLQRSWEYSTNSCLRPWEWGISLCLLQARTLSDIIREGAIASWAAALTQVSPGVPVLSSRAKASSAESPVPRYPCLKCSWVGDSSDSRVVDTNRGTFDFWDLAASEEDRRCLVQCASWACVVCLLVMMHLWPE